MLSPPSEGNEVSFALYTTEVEKYIEPSIMMADMIEDQDPTDDDKMWSDVVLATYSEDDKENIDSSEMTVEMLDEYEDHIDERAEESEEAAYHDARSDSSDSTYYDVNDNDDDDDLDSFFDKEDVLVSPPLRMQVEPVIDLTRSSSASDGETSRVARMLIAVEEERYARQQLSSGTSDDEVELVTWKSEGKCDQKVPAMVDLKEDQELDVAGLNAIKTKKSDLEEASMVDRTSDQEVEPEENVPDVEMVHALMMVNEDVQPDERIMNPGDRHRAVVSYRLDELTQMESWNESDEVTIGSGSNRIVNVMEEVDPAFVNQMDLAIILNDASALIVCLVLCPMKVVTRQVRFVLW